MIKLKQPGRQVEYDRLWNQLFERLYNGRRIYHEFPTIQTLDYCSLPVATICTINTAMSSEFDTLMDIEFGPYKDRKQYSKNFVDSEIYAQRLIDQVWHRTTKDHHHPISYRITNQWPSCAFDSWLEETHSSHWMTTKYTRHKDVWQDAYIFETKVHAPITGDVDEYKSNWGQSILLTKMTTS